MHNLDGRRRGMDTRASVIVYFTIYPGAYGVLTESSSENILALSSSPSTDNDENTPLDSTLGRACIQ